jgi:hypothetical protein
VIRIEILIDIRRRGDGRNPAKLDAAQRAALAERVERGPIPTVDGVVRWRLGDLVGWIWIAASTNACASDRDMCFDRCFINRRWRASGVGISEA